MDCGGILPPPLPLPLPGSKDPSHDKTNLSQNRLLAQNQHQLQSGSGNGAGSRVDKGLAGVVFLDANQQHKTKGNYKRAAYCINNEIYQRKKK